MGSRIGEIVPAEVELFILTGPTAVGKTELALRWAEMFNAEIVSCDSLIFYRGMDIGTAKPSRQERERVPHHLIDVADPGEPWNIERYLHAAVETVIGIHRRGRRVLVTGGSGFYLKSFIAPVVDSHRIPAEIIRHVEELSRLGPEALAHEMRRVDPEAGEFLDLDNPRRVARALERSLTTGRTVRELREEMDAAPFPFSRATRRICLLSREREDLRERIEHRVDTMLDAGLVQEVRNLLKKGLKENPSAASAIGYRETIRYLEGELPKSELRDLIARNTNRLVKKQLTWFRHQLPEETRVICLTQREKLDCKDLFEAKD